MRSLTPRISGGLIALLVMLSLAGNTGVGQDSAKPPSLQDLWRLSDSVTRAESRSAADPGAATYLYIDDFEVRHEILLPFYALEDWVNLEYADPFHIETTEQNRMRRPIERLFTDKLPVTIDGLAVQAVVGQIEFVAPQYIDSMQVSRSEPIDAYTSWVGIILSYGTKGTPSSVEVTWDMFNEHIPQASAIVYAFEDRGDFGFAPPSPTYRWDNPGRPPIPPINEVVQEDRPWWQFWGGGLGEAEASAILQTLLKNVYRAFDYHTDSDVYEALALSVGGELLDEIYLQIRRSLAMQEQGGAISRIQEVTFVDSEAEELTDNSFDYTLRWTVKGTVEHWGHIHARTNGYRAAFRVQVLDGAWRIVKMQVLSQERLGFESTLRE